MSYNDRVAALRAGTGAPALDANSVLDDGHRDRLFGGHGLDWFFAADPDTIYHKISAEQVN